ncbi:MAG TPA: ATP-binding protein [Casimicrobiaceae bacterium]
MQRLTGSGEREVAISPPASRRKPLGQEILSELAASLSMEHDQEALLGRFLGPIVQLAGAEAGAVRVLTDDGKRLRIVGAVGLPPEVLEREALVDAGCGACGGAARHDDVEEVTDLATCAERSACGYFGSACGAVIAVPLRHKGRMLGIYNLFLAPDKRVSPDALALLRSIGELLGLALENARLARDGLRASLIAERHLLANEVHDSLAQALAYMKMRLALLEQALARHDEARASTYLSDVSETLSTAYGSLRVLLTQFRSPMDAQGLMHALEQTVQSYRQRTGVEIAFDNRAPDMQLPVEHEVQVFHIVQEALANISRHSGARHAHLRVDRVHGKYRVTIDDDGTGFGANGAAQTGAGATDSAHLGLRIMRERAQHIGGEIRIESAHGRGTRVRLEIPVAETAVGALP